jgi:hypothetical protein
LNTKTVPYAPNDTALNTKAVPYALNDTSWITNPATPHKTVPYTPKNTQPPKKQYHMPQKPHPTQKQYQTHTKIHTKIRPNTHNTPQKNAKKYPTILANCGVNFYLKRSCLKP